MATASCIFDGMSAAKKFDLVSIDDYLAGELVSPVKHEYFGGVVYAMAGATNTHNRIATNAIVGLSNGLRGKKCQVFNSDTKIRIRLSHQTRFYYPDVSVICRPNSQLDSFQDDVVVLIEVLLPNTCRIDEVEKMDAYRAIPSLSVYMLVEQDSPAIVVHRRVEHRFEREIYTGMDAVLPLPEIGTELSLAEIYEAVEFVAEEEDI